MTCLAIYSPSFRLKALHEPLRVAGDHVDLEVDPAALGQLAERGPLERLGDQRDLEAVLGEARRP